MRSTWLLQRGGAPAKLDYVLVPRYGRLGKARVILNQPEPKSDFAKAYGLEKLWPTERFGWSTQMQLLQCSSVDYTKEN